MPMPATLKIYHIVHVDRLTSISADGCLWCDVKIEQHAPPGTMIGMNSIKQRRLNTMLNSHPDLHVGDCVPFYFCPRSIMLYLIYRANHPDLDYRGGQGPIVHLEADLHDAVDWADRKGLRWAFTLSNAGAVYFEDRCDWAQLDEIDWDAIRARDWNNCKEGKQAEFLVEQSFPWELIRCVGVHSRQVGRQVSDAIQGSAHRPQIEIKPDWYYG